MCFNIFRIFYDVHQHPNVKYAPIFPGIFDDFHRYPIGRRGEAYWLSGSGRPDPPHINSLRLILNAKTITIILVKLTIQVQKGSCR